MAANSKPFQLLNNPADKIERWATDKLVPYARNARTHTDEQIGQIAASIKEWGWTTPILVDEVGSIIAGHGRTLAAQKLNITEVPVVIAKGWSDAKKRAYVIADNKLALNAGWDNAMLKLELTDLESLNFDLDLTGFNSDEIAALMPLDINIGLTDEDDVPETPVDPITKLNDVWILGNHRLMCGDSTSIDAFDKLMNGIKADMVFTDPPYGMSYGGGRSGKVGSTDGTLKKFGVILGDTKIGNDLISMIKDAVGSAKQSSKEGASLYVCFPWRTYSEFEAALISIGLDPTACIVWDKKSIGLGHANYRPQHEFIFYFKGGAWYGDKAQSDVWYMSRGNTSAYVHPTQKPVELVERALSNSSKHGDVIIDCFGGSGSSLIACEKTNRHARLMELDPKYCDVIIKRWQDYTGKQATLESTNEPFAVAA